MILHQQKIKLCLVKKKSKYWLLGLIFSPAIQAANELQMTDILMNLYNYLTGTIAATMALLMTVFIGYQVLGTGRIEKTWLWACAIGFGLLFGSKSITNMLGITI
ncbi:MAG: TrbC/VirB2 family protein [Endozoicomonadaceae bacterium]|nr:TrbC/VirB2 family protein [Endozoicomonadaceae bacterium]